MIGLGGCLMEGEDSTDKRAVAVHDELDVEEEGDWTQEWKKTRMLGMEVATQFARASASVGDGWVFAAAPVLCGRVWLVLPHESRCSEEALFTSS